MKLDLTQTNSWPAIKEKARLYQTAKLGNDCVKIIGVVREGIFMINHPKFGDVNVPCVELTNFGL